MDKKHIIALDYDSTYNLNSKFWDDFIISARQNGFEVILATYRHEELDFHPDFEHLQELMEVRCYFTDGKAKKPFLEELGVEVDIWIDDRPKTVYEDSAWGQDSPELHAWREANKKELEKAA